MDGWDSEEETNAQKADNKTDTAADGSAGNTAA